MKKTMKKLIRTGVLTAAVCVLCACGNKDSDAETSKRLKESNKKVNEQAEEFEFTEEERGAVLTKYNGSDEDVVIPEEYNNLPVVRIADSAFEKNEKIKSVKIPDTVQSIDKATLPEKGDIIIYAAINTAGEMYSYERDLDFEIDGENTVKASCVTIYDTEGKFNETIYAGEEPKEEFLSGVSLKEQDGETVLLLDNCNIGGISVDEFAALTIQLADGSENTVTGNSGLDGISSNGNLTITGNGTLHVSGSDYYSIGEGDKYYIGWGISVLGSLTIENQVKIDVRPGASQTMSSVGIQVNRGNFTIKDSRVEVLGSSEGAAKLAVLVFNDDNLENSGKLILEQAQIAEGGSLVEIKNDDGVCGMGIGTGDITYDEITESYVNAASYARIEPAAGQ